eukprot:TRINITY_DN13770_c0_g1_i1.p1 TRINITY_DN13770_c0_g1~~TRINITY_DN13770_c0_g1_i1.p1  ORF type:complete len:399 (+),score=62.05 TRINITY_DN13770_c0_g1_i1:48-1244(+)
MRAPCLVLCVCCLAQPRMVLTARITEKHVQERSSEAGASEASLHEITSWKHAPLIVNTAKTPMVVFLECAFLFNRVVIQPGEAASLWSHKGPHYLPYTIYALMGDEDNLPTSMDSLKMFLKKAAVPAAFLGGVVVSVATWGALTGPSAALAPLITGFPALKIGGAVYTLAAVDVALGVSAAAVADAISEKILQNPKAIMAKKPHLLPGNRYFQISGGVQGVTKAGDQVTVAVSDLKLDEIDKSTFTGFNISVNRIKTCLELSSQGIFYRPAFTVLQAGDRRLQVDWRHTGSKYSRPVYTHPDNPKLTVEWHDNYNNEGGMWRFLEDTTLAGKWRRVLYKSKVNSGEVPDSGWEAGLAGYPVPTLCSASSASETCKFIKEMQEPEATASEDVQRHHSSS